MENRKSVTLTLPNPTAVLVENISTMKESVTNLLFSANERLSKKGPIIKKITHIPSSIFNSFKNFKFKKTPRLIFPAIVVVVALLLINAFMRSTTSETVLPAETEAARYEVKPALATATINKELVFPINDERGRKAGEFKYIVETVELKDEIVVKGQKATAVKGRVFLIVNVKIINELDQTIQINSRDFIRLSANNTDEWLAPDIHNDPVDAQAIATKYTRLGFAINETDKNLVLQVGEITGEKQKIPVSF